MTCKRPQALKQDSGPISCDVLLPWRFWRLADGWRCPPLGSVHAQGSLSLSGGEAPWWLLEQRTWRFLRILWTVVFCARGRWPPGERQRDRLGTEARAGARESLGCLYPRPRGLWPAQVARPSGSSWELWGTSTSVRGRPEGESLWAEQKSVV